MNIGYKFIICCNGSFVDLQFLITLFEALEGGPIVGEPEIQKLEKSGQKVAEF